jgi:hypothetical protein
MNVKQRDFRIWGRIEQIAPGQFVTIASAVRDDGGDSTPNTMLRVLPDRESAREALRQMVQAVGKLVTDRGDRVVDVEVDE